MCDEGHSKSDDIREGYVKPLGTTWKKVTYANVDGRAIFEGCIILGDTDDVEETKQEIEQQLAAMPALLTEPNAAIQGIAIRGQQYRWPKRTVPYIINDDVPNQRRITDAIAHWEANTSIRFKPRTTERDYVRIVQVASGCASAVGRQGGEQQLILADSCTLGNVIHELGHTVGLWHEQSRADRDNYVEIVFSKVDPQFAHNFNQRISDGIDVLDYDYASIMHYPPRAFSTTGEETIKPRRCLAEGIVMGQRNGLSKGDIATVEKIYENVPRA